MLKVNGSWTAYLITGKLQNFKMFYITSVKNFNFGLSSVLPISNPQYRQDDP